MPETLEVRKSAIAGRGCFARVPFRRRQKIAAFAGEIVRGQREIYSRMEGSDIYRMVWLAEDVAIDTNVGGDATAYVNHSCAPNAFMRVAPGQRVLIFALRDIAAGEEITVDYRDPAHPPPEGCKCGAPNCRSLK